MLFPENTYPPLKDIVESALTRSAEIIGAGIQHEGRFVHLSSMMDSAEKRRRTARRIADYYERQDRQKRGYKGVSDVFLIHISEMHHESRRQRIEGAVSVLGFVKEYLNCKIDELKNPVRTTVVEVFTLAADIIKFSELTTREKQFAKEEGLNVKSDVRVRAAQKNWPGFFNKAARFSKTHVENDGRLYGRFRDFEVALKGDDWRARLRAAAEANDMFALYLETNPPPRAYNRRPSRIVEAPLPKDSPR